MPMSQGQKAKRFSKPVKGQIDYSCLIYPDILKDPVKQLFSTVRENTSDGFQGGWGTPQGAVYPTPPGDLSIHPSIHPIPFTYKTALFQLQSSKLLIPSGEQLL